MIHPVAPAFPLLKLHYSPQGECFDNMCYPSQVHLHYDAPQMECCYQCQIKLHDALQPIDGRLAPDDDFLDVVKLLVSTIDALIDSFATDWSLLIPVRKDLMLLCINLSQHQHQWLLDVPFHSPHAQIWLPWDLIQTRNELALACGERGR